jgi:hypothetical protein
MTRGFFGKPYVLNEDLHQKQRKWEVIVEMVVMRP